MADGQGIVGNIAGKVAETGKGIATGIKSELEESIKTTTTQISGSQPNDQQMAQAKAQEEAKKQQRLNAIRSQLHQEALMMGVSAPTPQETPQEEEKSSPGLSELGSLRSGGPKRNVLLEQTQTRRETGRNFKG